VVSRVVKDLYRLFGGHINSKGYRVLSDSIRVIQGDGVDTEAIRAILQALKADGYSAENIAFGMGGGLLQKPNRDDLSFAMKVSAICVDGVWRDVYKNPITDSHKRSKRGRLALTQGYESVRVEELGEREDLLQPIYRDGRLLKELSFDEVRRNKEKRC